MSFFSFVILRKIEKFVLIYMMYGIRIMLMFKYPVILPYKFLDATT